MTFKIIFIIDNNTEHREKKLHRNGYIFFEFLFCQSCEDSENKYNVLTKHIMPSLTDRKYLRHYVISHI